MAFQDRPEHIEHVNDGYRAVGRYFVEFSQLIHNMRELVVRRLASDPVSLGYLAAGEAMAYQIKDSFFGMCRFVTDHDDAEKNIAKRLRGFVTSESEMRNYFAHGDWFVDLPRYNIVPLGTAQLVRIKPMRDDGHIEAIDLTAKDIDKRSDQIAVYRDLIAEYGMICFQMRDYKGLRVGDVLIRRGGNVVREGPRAPEAFKGL